MLLRAVRQRLGRVEARFADRHGTALDPAHGDVLIAADGIHSTGRALLYPDEGPPRWNGVMMWRGATDWPAFLTGHSMIIAGGTAAKLVIYPIAEGGSPGAKLTNWAICIRTGEPGTPPRAPAAPVDARAGDDARRRRAPDVPDGFQRGRPGVLDATSLSRHLAANGAPAAALAAYQDERLPVTGEVVLRNRVGGVESVIDEVERRAPTGSTGWRTSSTPPTWRRSSVDTPEPRGRPRSR